MSQESEKKQQYAIMSGERPKDNFLSEQDVFNKLSALQANVWLYWNVYKFREKMKKQGFKKSLA